MAQLVNVRLSRGDASPWGFRLQGGKDFGQPLLVQKVNGGSLAERAGLQVGDALIKVNNVDVQDMRHKDAQDTIVRAGNGFELTIQRGGTTTWKPSVTPVGAMPSPGGRSPQTVTKTSLAAKPNLTPMPSGHNVTPKPFAGVHQVNGGDVKAIVNKQYNSPMGMYSEATIAETLSAQAEVLAGGAIGVNFMKNEKTYDSQKSEVFKMIKEVEKEPKDPEPAPLSNTKYFSMTSHAVGGRTTSPRPLTPIARQMGTPELPQDKPNLPPPSSTPGSPSCSECGKHIVGVFVRIKEKNLHVECFKCATCGTSLKNVGYYNINNKLYCDVHAKMAARQNPPAPNLEPVTVPPGGRIPTGSTYVPTIPSVPTAGPKSPQPGTVAPMPFHAPRLGTRHVVFPRYGGQTSSNQAPKPFGSQNAPSTPTMVPFNLPSAPSTPMTNFPKPGFSPLKPTSNYRGGGSMGGGSMGGGGMGGGFGGGVGGGKSGAMAGSSAPKRGRGVLNAAVPAGGRVPLCGHCNGQIRGPFITALGKIWCPDHFMCCNAKCKRPLQDIGFVEEPDGLYCEYCFEQYLAPTCDKCHTKIKGDCLNAIGKHFHPQCFSCSYCDKLFGNDLFFLEDNLPYCENDWNELFTTKCIACGFPIEAGDRWVEALKNNYHSKCFNCSLCKKNLEGQSFIAKGGRPYCKTHGR
ncbi:PDZ and LIM domain protein Zasp isoform X4 [Cimex lectularius]|uniref:PDZ and LIM domain protein Zasp n=1 Tax=Cimex lectularius TaxID=79782 RepID=A0A8I6R9E9_CIMLE|nr:PDZ and LIM domain protein Zasp isoform X4 [Cimex lectularius]